MSHSSGYQPDESSEAPSPLVNESERCPRYRQIGKTCIESTYPSMDYCPHCTSIFRKALEAYLKAKSAPKTPE